MSVTYVFVLSDSAHQNPEASKAALETAVAERGGSRFEFFPLIGSAVADFPSEEVDLQNLPGVESVEIERKYDLQTDEEAKQQFVTVLEASGALVDLKDGEKLDDLSPRITHVRHPDGSVERIRFNASVS